MDRLAAFRRAAALFGGYDSSNDDAPPSGTDQLISGETTVGEPNSPGPTVDTEPPFLPDINAQIQYGAAQPQHPTPSA